jgi:hypothetical protein
MGMHRVDTGITITCWFRLRMYLTYGGIHAVEPHTYNLCVSSTILPATAVSGGWTDHQSNTSENKLGKGRMMRDWDN